MFDRSRKVPRWALVPLAVAAVLAASGMCIAPRPTEPPAAPRQAIYAAVPTSTVEALPHPHVGLRDAGADTVAELLRRSVEAYEVLGAKVAEANPHPDQRAVLQALRAVCAHNALQAALVAYLAEGTDPVEHMRAHARPRGPDPERTCERAVLSAAGLLESQLALAPQTDGGSAIRGQIDPAHGGRMVPPAAGGLP